MPLSTIFQSYRGGINRSTQRKPLTCRKSRINIIAQCCIEYTSPWVGFELTALVIIGTDCIGSCNPTTIWSRQRWSPLLLGTTWSTVIWYFYRNISGHSLPSSGFEILLKLALNTNQSSGFKNFVLDRAPDKLRICVFYAMKTSKNTCIIRSECTHYAYILLCKQTFQIRSVLVQSCT